MGVVMADALSPILSESCWWITPRGAERRVVKRFNPADRLSLSAVFNGAGARCQLPSGEVVEVVHRKTPFYDLCRELDRLGYGEHRIEISTPKGPPSMRAVVSIAAGLRVSEDDQSGLRLRRYRPFPPAGLPQECDEAVEGIPTPENAPAALCDSDITKSDTVSDLPAAGTGA